MPAAINFIKNYLVQVTRKSPKKILLLFLALRGYDYYDDYKSSTLQSVISEISFVCRNLVQETLPSIVKIGITVFFYSFIIGCYNAKIGVAYLLACGLYMVLSALLSRKNSSDIALALDATVEVNKFIDDYVKNIDTIYSYKSFKHESTLFDSKLSDEKIPIGGYKIILIAFTLSSRYSLLW